MRTSGFTPKEGECQKGFKENVGGISAGGDGPRDGIQLYLMRKREGLKKRKKGGEGGVRERSMTEIDDRVG